MELSIKPAGSLNGTVKIPESKSYTHRAIILGTLAKGLTTIHNPLISDDITATINACRSVGAEIVEKPGQLEITGLFCEPHVPIGPIDVGNSGTTLRIMTAVASLCDREVTLTGDESIQKRPMEPLLDALAQLGVSTKSTKGMAPLTVKGPIRGGKCQIRGDVSSQFISALLLATPLAKEETVINLTTPLLSRPYVDITLDLIREFGGDVEKGYNAFRIPENQIYMGIDYEIEGDYSAAGFILGAAAITNSNVTVPNLLRSSRQGDKRIVDILREMGANVHVTGDAVTVRGSSQYGELDGLDIDMGDNPDLVPVVAVLATFARGNTKIRNIEHLRHKESNRLKALATELNKMGARVRDGKDRLDIMGVKTLKGARVHGWNDHRIVMALAIAALRAEGETVIDTAESIKISFPGFVEEMRKMGAEVDMS